jgi:mannitol-1-/sugar-/sorbitol-6-phosphatase
MDDSKKLHCKAILFDMDGTLLDSSAVIERAWRWWTAKHSIPLEPVMAVQQGRPNKEVLRQFGPQLDIDQESNQFLKFEENDVEGIVPMPGALDAVKVAQQGPWAIVTSADRSLAEVRLKATNIPVPDVFITADAIHHGKPNPECYLLAAQALGVYPVDCVVFEDAVAGVAAGKAAGMRVVGVLTSLTKKELSAADLWIHDFRDVKISRTEAGLFELTIRQ